MRGSKRYSVPKHDELWEKAQSPKHKQKIGSSSLQLKHVKRNNYRWILVAPFLEVIIQFLAFILCYCLALEYGHVDVLPYIPYPNEIISTSPEKEIFTICIAVSCYLTFTIVTIRYKQTLLLKFQIASKLSLFFGFFMIISKLTIAVISKSFNGMIEQIVGWIFITSTTFYIAAQAYITYKTKQIASRTLCMFRVILTLLMFCLLGGMVACVLLNNTNISYSFQNTTKIIIWSWIVLSSCYILMCYKDFKYIMLSFKVLSNASANRVKAYCPINDKHRKESTVSFDQCSYYSDTLSSVNQEWCQSPEEVFYDASSMRTMV